jgi:hypothetical protein
MTQGIEEAITSLQTKSTSAGCVFAPTTAISQMGPSPFSVAFEGSGETLIHSAGFAEDLAVIIVQHHVSESILPASITKAASLRDVFLKALRDDPQLGGAVSTIVSIKRRFGEMTFGKLQTIGYQYEIKVKINLNNT